MILAKDIGNSLLSKKVITLEKIQTRLLSKNQTLAQAIAERDLYFRISLVGACNLRCPFCHNEGAPTRGKADIDFVTYAMTEAHAVGFRRVQFTGGEPLLHPKVEEFVKAGKRIFNRVGITTNGTFLEHKINNLIDAEITNIHISLQAEVLRQAGNGERWGVPAWLEPMLKLSSEGYFQLRLNMPVPADEMDQAQAFLEDIAMFGCDIKVFSILPEGSTRAVPYPLEKLESLVSMENSRRAEHNLSGRVFLRGYRPPSGIRCASCQDFDKCKEQSHSLRLGADRILRPCLATRDWDMLVSHNNLYDQIRDATLLALDYTW